MRMTVVGCYRGVRWRYSRLCDVMVFPQRGRYYFPLGDDGKPTGDYFQTLREMRQWIDGECES